MKIKNLCAVFMSIAIACSQAVSPVFATEATPKGDWTDTTAMTPVYEVKNQSLAAQKYLETDEEFGDFILDFEVSMNGRYLIRRAIDGATKNWSDIRMSWATEARGDSTTQGTGRHVQQTVKGNGWFDFAEADADYPTYTGGRNIAFRYQVKNGTISLWAADLGTEEEPIVAPEYKYAGYYTHANAKNKLGTVQLYCENAQTVKSFKVYNIGGTAEYTIKDATTGVLSLSEVSQSELSQNAITLTDSFGKKITSSAVTKISDTTYSVEFSENIESGVNYSVDVDAATSLGGGYVVENINYLAASMEVDFDDETWSEYVTLRSSGDLLGPNQKANVSEGNAKIMNSDKIITLNDYSSNAIIEFDAIIPSTNTGAGEKAYLHIDTVAGNYTQDDNSSIAQNRNTLWIKNGDGTTGKVQRLTYKDNSLLSGSHHTMGSANADIAKEEQNSYRIAKASINGNVITVEYTAEPVSVLTDEDFAVTDGENNVVSVLGVERVGAKTYKLTIETPDKGAEYTVASSATNIYGANLEDATVQALGYTLVTGAENSTAVFTNIDSASDAAVIFAVYTDGVLDSVEIKNISDVDENDTLTLGGVKENQTCSLFVWNSVDSMKAFVK